MTLLYHAQRYDEIAHKESFDYVNAHKKEFLSVLNEVITFAQKNIYPPRSLNKGEGLMELYEKNQEKDMSAIAQSFINLLQLDTIGAPTDFKFFGTEFKKIRYRSLTDIWKATIIYQSITGLRETRTRMATLWDGEQ